MEKKGIFKDKKQVIRMILFVIAFAVAITAFSMGVLGLSKNKEGYQTVDASPDEEAVLYASDFSLIYYFQGKSGEIKELRKEISAAYSAALSRAYKLLDKNNSYEGFVNLATLNSKPGENVKVSTELYAILKDAYSKTLKDQGYNMFAGALYDYVNSILILEDPEEFDPLNNSETAERIKLLAELAQEKNFGLRFIDDNECTVCFEITDTYKNGVEELETADAAPLDLNLLKDAYILEIVIKALDNAGFTNGYISSKSGLTVALSGQDGLKYGIYGIKGSDPAILKTIESDGRAVYSLIKAFGFSNESMYYTIMHDGVKVYRNPFISAADGESNSRLLTKYLVWYQNENAGQKENYVVDTLYENLTGWFGTAGAPNGAKYHSYAVGREKTDEMLEDNEILQ